MPRAKIDIKGIMTDLPPENIPQGACQEIVNLRFVDGAWRPVSSKKIDYEHIGNVKEMFIHQIEGFQIKIVYIGNSIYYLYYTESTGKYSYAIFSFYGSSNIGTSKDLRFSSFNQVLFIQNLTDGYTYVTKLVINGNEYSYTDVLRWDFDLPKLHFYSSYTKSYRKFFTTLDEQKKVAEAAYLGLKDEAENNNHFCNRIFVRYALKMFDGSYIKHSTIFPVYHDVTKQPYIENYGRDTSGTTFRDESDSLSIDNPFDAEDKVSFKHSITILSSLLRFSIPSDLTGSDNTTLISTLKLYKDYIVSLDIFVSAPTEIWDIDNIPINLGLEGLASNPDNNMFSLTVPNNSEEFESLNAFYLFKSIPIDNLTIGDDISLGFISEPITNSRTGSGQIYQGSSSKNRHRNAISTGSGDYNSLELSGRGEHLFSYTGENIRFDSRKILPLNDYAHTAVGSKVLTYNSRLFIGNIFERLFNGYPTLHLCERASSTSGGYTYNVSCFVYIETEEGEKIVQSNVTYAWFDLNYTFYLIPFLTYPDARAKKIAIYFGTTGTYYGIEFKTKVHPFLNLAYAYTGENENQHYSTWRVIDPYAPTALTTLPTITSTLFNDRNQLMISRVNNPFVFPAEDTNNVGKNDILEILTNAKELSDGQFGLHPIIILTKAGIWAIQIGTGAVFTKNIVPISSDECTGEALNFYSKTLNSDVIIYLSRTGVKILQGTEVVDITAYVKREKPSILDFLTDAGYTEHTAIAAGTELGLNEYAELTADWSIFIAGQWIVRVSLTGTVQEQYDLIDKSYWFYTNFDNYLVPKADEKTGWDNNTSYNPDF